MKIKGLMAMTVAVLTPVIVGCVQQPKPALPLGWFTDGTYEMGHDVAQGFIPPGLYMSEPDGNEDSAARLDTTGNVLSGVVADRVIIQVSATDAFVEVTGLIKPWEVRYPSPNVPLRGIWLVGSEWAANTYQITPHPDGNTYWERWADINGETVIASDSTTGPSVMSVDPADVAVGVHGVWAL